VEEVEGRMPMSWSWERRRVSCLCRKGESGGRAESRWASCLRLPQSLLYFALEVSTTLVIY
jgi:hypothetical protein